MKHPDEFESGLTDGMHEATRDVIAHPELQQRLLDAVTGTAPTRRGLRAVGASRRSSRLLTTWMLPAAASTIMLLTAGTVVVAHEFALNDPVKSGDGTVVTDPSDHSAQPLPSEPTTVPSAPSTTASPARSHPASTPPPTSSAPSDTATQAGPPDTSAPRSTSPAASSKPHRHHRSVAPQAPVFPAACTKPDTGEYLPTSLQDFEEHMIGTWLVCSEPSIFNTDDAGLQIDSDGSWAKLTRDSSGRLVAGRSSGEKGRWEAVDDSEQNGHPSFQINLRIDGSGTVIAGAYISSGVQRVKLDNNGFYTASYVPTSDAVH